MLYVILVILIKLPLLLLLRPKVFGNKENLRIKGGAIFICNHRALMDPVMLALVTPMLMHFKVKKKRYETRL